MTGVEILSSEAVHEIASYPWLIAAFGGIAFLITSIIVAIDWFQLGFDIEGVQCIIVATAFGMFVGLVGFIICTPETDIVDHIEYKVTIDDSVSMNEFLDKYEILDQEGKIYTVKERE